MLLPILLSTMASTTPPGGINFSQNKVYCLDGQGQVYETYGTCPSIADVPGPLSILGAGVAYKLSRDLRKRINDSNNK